MMDAERTAEVIVRVHGYGKEDLIEKLGKEVARACHGYGLITEVSVLTAAGEQPINFDPIIFDGNEPPGYTPPATAHTNGTQ
jgi:nitrogenase subunit NifH